MNTPWLRRGARGDSFFKFSFTCTGTPIYSVVVYFVCDSAASELERWALLPFKGFLP